MRADQTSCPRWIKILAVSLAAFTFLLLIPVLAVGFYIHPFGDDYIFGYTVYHSLSHKQPLLPALLNIVQVYWGGWQGTFSGVITMTLMPDSFVYRGYILTPFIMIGMLMLSSGKLLHTIIRKMLNGTRWHWLALWSGTVLLFVQRVPDPAQSFYWWNGASLYTLFFALMLLFADRLLELVRVPHQKWKLPIFVQALILSFIMSGGNYISGLLTALILALFWFGVLLFDRSNIIKASTLLVVFVTGFLTSVLAPGNQVRAATGTGLSAFAAIRASLLQAANDLFEFSSFFLLSIILLMLPVLWDLAGRSAVTCPYVGIVPVFSFLLFAAQNASHFYTLGDAGPGRIRDIEFYSFVVFLITNAILLIIWLRHKFPLSSLNRAPVVFASAALLLCVISTVRAFPYLTAGKALSSLADGSLSSYHTIMMEREAMYRNSDISVVRYSPARGNMPLLIYVFSPDGPNPEDFVNVAARNFYEKDSVVCIS